MTICEKPVRPGDPEPVPRVRPILVRELEVAADHGQIYIYSPEGSEWADYDPDGGPYLRALDDAVDSRRFVGAAGGMVDLLTPGQWNFHTPMRVEVWLAEPEASESEEHWQHEVDIDLDVPDGELVFEASGGGPQVATRIRAGSYRARISGHGFTALGAAGAEGADEYRIRLWPRREERAPELRRYWSGWDDYR